MMQAFLNSLQSNKIYEPKDIKYIYNLIKSELKLVINNKKIKYYNIPCSFDIETSSFFRSTGKNENEKCSCMYVWTFGILGYVIIGRTWDEYIKLCKNINTLFVLSDNVRLVVYVHNLSYEFQFMRKWFEWIKVFALDSRKPIYAICDTGIEYRCSYLLSGYALSKLGDELQEIRIQKLIGDLDYNLIRHSKTPLTEKEIGYCVNDCKIVMAYIMERIITDGDISKIPMTKTGYVRQYCRDSCFKDSNKRSYKKLRYMEMMRGLRLTPDEYKQLKRAFQGGFTHSNPFFSGKVLNNVFSFDFTSSYPCVMISEKFPMSSSEKIEIKSREQFYFNLKTYCCLFDVEITGLQSRLYFDNYISISRCWGVKNAVVNNGRVVKADRICTTITEQDFYIIKKFYIWEKGGLKVGNFRRYKKDYLPSDFVKAIIKLYKDKTELKGVEGKEVEYLRSKEMINSCYGMAVTDIVRDDIVYDENEWKDIDKVKAKSLIEGKISHYNSNRSRFLFYPWGVWVTAYARRNLFTGILEFGDDYIYSDTDSIKVLNADSHREYIDDYNTTIRKQLENACRYHGIDIKNIEPKTIKGVKKCLGVWDFEGVYDRFKTLGAKRYMVEHDGEISITVSGLNKKVCVPYLVNKYGDDIFSAFNDDLYIPPEYTGKNTHTYIDDRRNGKVKDYMGVYGEYDELSCIHLGPADYSLSLSREYVEYILSIQTEEFSG